MAALTTMRRYSESRAALTVVSGMAVRMTAATPAASRTGMATYIKFSFSVVLKRMSWPTRPAKAAFTSGRSAWFSMPAGDRSDSASTVPSRAMTVMRVPEAAPSLVTRASRLAASAGESWSPICPWTSRARASRSCSVCVM